MKRSQKSHSTAEVQIEPKDQMDQLRCITYSISYSDIPLMIDSPWPIWLTSKLPRSPFLLGVWPLTNNKQISLFWHWPMVDILWISKVLSGLIQSSHLINSKLIFTNVNAQFFFNDSNLCNANKTTKKQHDFNIVTSTSNSKWSFVNIFWSQWTIKERKSLEQKYFENKYNKWLFIWKHFFKDSKQMATFASSNWIWFTLMEHIPLEKR